MNETCLTLLGKPWLCLTAVLLLQGCGQQAASWNGTYAADSAGGARVCVAPAVAAPDGQAVAVQVQMSGEGGWCGVTLNRGGAAYDSYMIVIRPVHGKVFAHHVGNNTRIDYTPDTGFAGADKFSVRLIPGNAVVQEDVTVTR